MKKSSKMVIFLICICLFIVIVIDITLHQMISFDIHGYDIISKVLLSEDLTPKVIFITNMGGALMVISLTAALYFVIKNKRLWYCILANLGIITFLNIVLKNILRRPRPIGFSLVQEFGYSFPSGHSMIGMAFYGYLIYLIYKHFKNKYVKWLCIFSLSLLISFIGISRIYLGVHYTSDVIGGFLFSLAYLIVYISFVNRHILRDDKVVKSAKQHYKNLIDSFKYAIDGIISSFKSERNMKIHVFVMIMVVIFGLICKISSVEWIICVICFGMVIGAELFNTALETTVDLAMPDKNSMAKLAKDISAGAVLVTAICSAIVGMIIFIPKIVHLFI